METLVKQILGHLHDFRFRSWPRNWGLKLLSFAFAFFLWYFVVGEDKVDMTVFVPIEIVNLPRDIVLSNQYKKNLEVTVSGPRGLVRGIDKQRIRRTVDLSKATAGRVVIRNEADSIPFSRGIAVLHIQPANITLQLERLITRDLPITPLSQGTLPEGLELASIRLEPATIQTSGPENILGETGTILTHPIDINGLKRTSKLPATLDLEPELTDLIGELEVTAHVVIQEKQVAVTIPRVIVDVDHDAQRTIYRLTPPTIKVQGEVPYFLEQKTVETFTFFTARIDAQGRPPGTYELPVTVSGKQGVKVIDFSPKKLTVKIGNARKAKKQKTKPAVSGVTQPSDP
jgi:YbbR domain-containing protein